MATSTKQKQGQIAKLDIHEKFQPLSHIVFIAGTNSGKTSTAASLLMQCRDQFYAVVVFSTTPSTIEFFQNYGLDSLIYEEYSETHLMRICDYVINTRNERPICIFLDDVMTSEEVSKSKALISMYRQVRHGNCWVWNTTQHATSIPSKVRPNIGYMFLHSSGIKEVVYSAYASHCINSFNTLQNATSAVSRGKGQFLVVSRVEDSNDFADCVFYYHGVPTSWLSNFTFCSRNLWYMQALIYQEVAHKRASNISLSDFAGFTEPNSGTKPPSKEAEPVAFNVAGTRR